MMHHEFSSNSIIFEVGLVSGHHKILCIKYVTNMFYQCFTKSKVKVLLLKKTINMNVHFYSVNYSIGSGHRIPSIFFTMPVMEFHKLCIKQEYKWEFNDKLIYNYLAQIALGP